MQNPTYPKNKNKQTKQNTTQPNVRGVKKAIQPKMTKTTHLCKKIALAIQILDLKLAFKNSVLLHT